MKTLILILIMTLTTSLLKAQHDTLSVSKYKCKIALTDTKYELQGEIYKTGDSAITLKKKMYNDSVFSKTNFVLMPIPVSRIDYISIYKKGSRGKGLLIGGLIGAVFGSIIGLAGGDDESTGGWDIINFSAEEKVGIGAIVGFIPGALIGLAAGSSKIIIGIHGNGEKYQKRKKELDSYSILN